MPSISLTDQHKEAIRSRLSPEQSSHLIYELCDDTFYLGNPDDITGWIRNVLSVETFFGAMCDGGITTWFDWDHAKLAPFVPEALRACNLPEFAECADHALQVHIENPYPKTVADWTPTLEHIRDAQLDEDFEEAYSVIEKVLFEKYHADPTHFRTKLHHYILAHLDE